MKWITANGSIRPLSEKKYSIKWDSESLSLFQFNVKQFFKKYWIEDIVGEEVLIPQTRLRVDIVNFSRKIAVEVNGLFHVEYTPYFQNSVEDFERQHPDGTSLDACHLHGALLEPEEEFVRTERV